MPSWNRGGGTRAPFGRPQILRSAKPGSFTEKPYTISGASHPTETIDGEVNKILYPGEVIAKITSGTHSGKFGVRQLGVADGREDLANVVGITNDFFPGGELTHRDVEASVLYQGSLVQAWCTERDAAGARVVLPNATADALRGKKNLDLLFD